MSGSLFDRNGLRAGVASARVAAAGPLRYGVDGEFWAYADGVWRPAGREVQRRIVRTLGEQYRPAHAATIRDVLAATLDEQHVAPVTGYLNMRNGMVRWDHPGEPALLEHHEEYGSTVQLPVAWRWDADCPAFERFLAEAVPEDDHQRVWEVLGYLMMSGNPLQRMVLLTGGGGNGKGVFLHVVRALLGMVNVANVPLHDFSGNQFASADIFGKLANICGDIDTTFIEQTGQIKQISGEDDVRAERKFGQPFTFEFWGKMLFSANAIPSSADGSAGWTRRWEVIQFPNAPTRPDRSLKGRLVEPESLEGIAVKAVWALRSLMERGDFDRGETASLAHHEFAKRSNKILAWIDDDMYFRADSAYKRRDLLMWFRAWLEHDSPRSSMGAQTFYERLRQVPGLREVKRRGEYMFVGLGRKADAHWVDLTDSETAPEEGGQTELPLG